MQAKSYLDRQNGKRGLEGSSGDEGQPDRKRPALASVIVEALKVDSLQKLCSSLEPILRRVVSEEVERALAKLGPAKLTSGSSPKYIQGPDGRNLQMHFRSRLSLPLFTGGKVEGEQGTAIHIVLIDANTGHVVTSGPESSAKLDVVVLEGDFNNEDDETWTAEEFESHVVKEREGKRPLLTGDLQVTLKEGVGTLGELSFTDNSSWIRSRKFRLGLKVAPGCCQGVRIREGKTDAFTVKDHRGELYKKHYPPALTDEVWRLEKIGKDGSFHKRLNKNGIYTVEDFLRLVVRDLQKLRNILGSGMSNKMWDFLFEHAKTCVLGGKVYVYYAEDAHNIGVVFNNIYELRGLIADGQYHSADSLSDNQKVYVDGLVKRAYDNWSQVVEYDDGNSFMDFKSNESAITSQNDVENDDVQDLLGSYGHQQQHQAPLPSVPVRVPQPPELRQPTMAAMPTITGYNNISPGFVIPSHDENLNASFIFDASPAAQHPVPTQHQQYQRNDHLLALGPPQASTSSPTFHQNNAPPPPPSNLASHRGLDDFFTEEEIRLRSHEMLENDDMQNLLRIFNMGGGGSSHGFHSFGGGVEDGSYPFPSTPYLPNPSSSYGFGDEQSRSSGKAVVGWLKLKAALRWGIFIRKKAAERRAQLVELDD